MVLFGWFLYAARDVMVTLLLAVVISSAFDPVVSYLEKKRIPRILGTIIIYLAALFVVGLIIYAFVPIALQEFTDLLKYSKRFLGPVGEQANIENIIDALSLNLGKFADLLFSGNISLIDIASRFLGGVFSVIALFVLSFYLTLGRDGVKKFLLAILPDAHEAKVINIYGRVTRKIGKWLTGQLFISLVVGLITFIGLWILGVKYSLLLGILAGVLEIIPFVGPIFTGAVAVLIALGSSSSLALYTFILFVVIQQLESHALTPIVMRYTTTLNPVVILTALLIGGKVFGPVGLILGVPVAVLFQEMIEEWTDHKQAKRGLGL